MVAIENPLTNEHLSEVQVVVELKSSLLKAAKFKETLFL
jgi:hypothetical protein